MVRERSEYQLSESGLELTFNFEDEEVNRLPPSFAVRDSGYALRTKQGAKTFGQVSYKVEANKTVPKGDLESSFPYSDQS
jgi:hypothetical protein